MSYPWISYADDLTFMAETRELLQKAADVLHDLLKRFGLVISIDKTKTIIFNWKGAKKSTLRVSSQSTMLLLKMRHILSILDL